MAQINLTSDDLTELSNSMMKWKDDLRTLYCSLCSQIKTMEGWRDPQFIMFLNAIETTSQQLESYVRNMEQMGRSLKIYANQQKEMNAHLRAQISSISPY